MGRFPFTEPVTRAEMDALKNEHETLSLLVQQLLAEKIGGDE